MCIDMLVQKNMVIEIEELMEIFLVFFFLCTWIFKNHSRINSTTCTIKYGRGEDSVRNV